MAKATTLWRQADFVKLWSGQTISEMGSTITRDAMPLLAVLVLGATPIQMGLLAALQGLPVLLFGIIAGVWVDRLRRRPVMLAADLGRAGLLLLIPLSAVLGVLRIELLYGLVILIGLLGVFFNSAYQAYLPSLVERSRLVEGNSKLAMGSSLAEIGGAGLAGVLVQTIGAPFAMLLDGISFLFSAGSLALIRHREPPPTSYGGSVAELNPTPSPSPKRGGEHEEMGSFALARAKLPQPPGFLPFFLRKLLVRPKGRGGDEAEPSFGREAIAGLRAVAGQPILRALVGAAATQSFLGNFFAPLYSLFAIRQLGLTPAALGLTIALGGVSSLAGAFLAGWVLRRFGLGPTLVGTLALTTLTAALIPLAGSIPGSGLILLCMAQLLGDALGMIYNIHTVSLRQAITPDQLLGRVNASLQLVNEGVAPLGALAGGVLAALLGIQTALFIAALHGILACLWIAASPIRKLKTIP